MTIISSQRYIDYKIVDKKIEEIRGKSEIILQTWVVGSEYTELEILFNGHHTLEAANELEIPVRFESTEHPEGLTGDDLLEQAWMDSDWYNVETGELIW